MEMAFEDLSQKKRSNFFFFFAGKTCIYHYMIPMDFMEVMNIK